MAGIIERDGKVLVCQRTEAQRHALQWEFPGGKVEPGEAQEAALVRELDEELGIRVTRVEEITRYHYQYPGRDAILLVFYRVVAWEGEPRNRIFQEMRWEAPPLLSAYDFVEGDVEFLRTLGGQA